MQTKFFFLIFLVNLTSSMDKGFSKNVEKWELSIVTEQKGKITSAPYKVEVPAEKIVPIPTKNSKIKCVLEEVKLTGRRYITCDGEKIVFFLSCNGYKEHSFTLTGSEDTRYLVNLKCAT